MDSEDIIKLIMEGQIGPGRINEIERCFDDVDRFDFSQLIKRIFDLNETYQLNKSESSKGVTGLLNKYSRSRKNKAFRNRLRVRDKIKQDTKIIVAEGDSWFEYPVFIKDVLDWLRELTDYPIYSLAYGGDWIGNIIYEGNYISELSNYIPDAFLISGGGNDLVGNDRVSQLIHRRKYVDTRMSNNDCDVVESLIALNVKDEYAEKIVVGKKFLNNDFWALLNVLRFQYVLMFKNIEKSGKFSKMKIITQGYDYAIPSNNRRILNKNLPAAIYNGIWLFNPLNIRGVYDQIEKESIVAAMIYEFNEMLIDLGKKNSNVFHIDCREYSDKGMWADELHLKSPFYKNIAKAYVDCIESNDWSKKVFKPSIVN